MLISESNTLTNLIIRTILFSSNPQKLSEFYQTYGLEFKLFNTAGIDYYSSTNSSLCIMRETGSSDCLGGLLKYELSFDNSESFNFSYDTKQVFAYGKACIPLEVYNSIVSGNLASEFNNNSWITVFRTSSIEEVKEFFHDAGLWTKEKHGEGPIHYCLNNAEQIFEIYPLRADSSISMEFIINLAKESNFTTKEKIKDLDGRKIFFMYH